MGEALSGLIISLRRMFSRAQIGMNLRASVNLAFSENASMVSGRDSLCNAGTPKFWEEQSYGFPSRRLIVCPTSRKFRIEVKGLVGTSATAMVSSGPMSSKQIAQFCLQQKMNSETNNP